MRGKAQLANAQKSADGFMLSEKSRGQADPLICGIVMAGGEGKRLRPFVHLLRGDLLPKQYVNFIGTRSMLEHTFSRVEKLMPAQRVFTIINQAHLQYSEVRHQLSTRRGDTVIVQPENKETAPGVLLPLMHLYKRYPDSIVVLFPSDHFVLEEDRLNAQIRLACRTVRNDPSRIILMGITPDEEETEYGYIMPGRAIKMSSHRAHEIAGFVEKPERATAKAMISSGALWNTMLMVFKTTTLLKAVKELDPRLYEQFQRIYESSGTPDAAAVTRDVYRQCATINFSRDILEPLAGRRPSPLITLPINNVLWSDWGSEIRVMDILRRTGNAARLNGLQRVQQGEVSFGRRKPYADATARSVGKSSAERHEADDAGRTRAPALTA